MRKFLFFWVMFLGIGGVTNAHAKVVSDGIVMCKIKGSTSGRTVQVFSTNWTGGATVDVVVSNDDSLGANITVKIEVTYTATGNKDVTETETIVSNPTFAKAQGETTISIPIETERTMYSKKFHKDATFKATNVKTISIEGNACE